MDQENEATGTVDADASVLLENGEPVAAIVSLPETISEAEAETGGNSDAVIIAEIEAERDVTIAAIHADVEAGRIEATEIIEIEREETWQEKVAELQESILELTNQIQSLAQASNQSQLMEAPLETTEELALELAEEPESSLTPEFTLALTDEMETAVSLDAGDESPVEEATVTVKRKRRLI